MSGQNSGCPYAEKVGAMESRIVSLERRLQLLQSEYDLSTEMQIKIESERGGMLKGMKIAAIVIGYSIIAGALIIAGHFMGFAELIIKIFKL